MRSMSRPVPKFLAALPGLGDPVRVEDEYVPGLERKGDFVVPDVSTPDSSRESPYFSDFGVQGLQAGARVEYAHPR